MGDVFVIRTEDGIHEQNLATTDVRREFGIVNFGFLGLLVALDEDFPDADGPAAVSQALLHGLPCREESILL